MTGNSDFPTKPTPGYQTGVGNVETLKLFQKFEDFIDYMEPIVDRFPAYERYVLRTAIKNCMYRIYEKIMWKGGKITDEKYLASIGSRCGHATGTASYRFYMDILLKSLQNALDPNRKILHS